MKFIWSTKIPTEPGFYWNRQVLVPEEVFINRLTADRIAVLQELLRLRPQDSGRTQWAGPIPLPVD